MRLSVLITALVFACTLAKAQTDTLLPLPDAQETASSPCRAFTLRQAIAPAALIGGACLVRPFDNDVKRFRDDHLFPFDNDIDDALQVAPGALMLALRAFGVEGRSQTWGQLLSATAFSGLITAGVTEGMKNTWGRTRPYRVWYHNSFPSGHTFSAFTSATLLHREYGGRSPWFGIGGYTAASLVGASRILNRDHWASDVLAGAGLGLVSGNLGYGLAESLFGNPRHGAPSFYGRNPSFLGVNAVVVPAGNGISGLKPAEDAPVPEYFTPEKPHVRFRHRCGMGYSIEGAYFPFPYAGIGCETALHYNYFSLDEAYFFSAGNPYASTYKRFETEGRSTTYFFLPGLYAAYPLGSRWLLGGKVLFGMGETQAFNVEAVTFAADGGTATWPYLYDWFDYGSAFKAGLHARYLATRYLEVKAEVDYSHTSAGYTFYSLAPTSGVSNLSVQVGAAIALQ